MFFQDAQVSRSDVQLAGVRVDDASKWSDSEWSKWSKGFMYPAGISDPQTFYSNQILGDAPNQSNIEPNAIRDITSAGQTKETGKVDELATPTKIQEHNLTARAFKLVNEDYSHNSFLNNYSNDKRRLH
jgi:hypothetical protein